MDKVAPEIKITNECNPSKCFFIEHSLIKILQIEQKHFLTLFQQRSRSECPASHVHMRSTSLHVQNNFKAISQLVSSLSVFSGFSRRCLLLLHATASNRLEQPVNTKICGQAGRLSVKLYRSQCMSITFNFSWTLQSPLITHKFGKANRVHYGKCGSNVSGTDGNRVRLGFRSRNERNSIPFSGRIMNRINTEHG